MNVSESLNAMLRQESRYDRIVSKRMDICDDESFLSKSPSLCNVRDYPATYGDTQWRHEMIDWACLVLDTLGIPDRTVVLARAFDLLDRYGHIPSRDEYQLHCMVCLRLAVALHNAHASLNSLTISALCKMSRHMYTPEQLNQVEGKICTQLQWKLHKPTAAEVCQLVTDDVQTKLLCELVVAHLEDSVTMGVACLVVSGIQAPSNLTVNEGELQEAVEALKSVYEQE